MNFWNIFSSKSDPNQAVLMCNDLDNLCVFFGIKKQVDKLANRRRPCHLSDLHARAHDIESCEEGSFWFIVNWINYDHIWKWQNVPVWPNFVFVLFFMREDLHASLVSTTNGFQSLIKLLFKFWSNFCEIRHQNEVKCFMKKNKLPHVFWRSISSRTLICGEYFHNENTPSTSCW